MDLIDHFIGMIPFGLVTVKRWASRKQRCRG